MRTHILSKRCDEDDHADRAGLCRAPTPTATELFRSSRCRNSKPQPRCNSIVAEGFHGAERKFGSRLSADRGELLENVGGRSDDVATHVVRFHDVEDFARGSPNDLDIASLARPRNRILHDRSIVDAEVGEPAGKYRDAGGRAGIQRLYGTYYLLGGKDRGHVDVDAFARKRANCVK